MRFAFTISVLTMLSVSVYFNIKQMRERLWVLHFNNANTRVTYDDFYHIKAAQKYHSGKGVKIGILDKYFDMSSTNGDTQEERTLFII